MTYELMLGLLKNCGDGEQLLAALNAIAIANDNSKKETVVAAVLPRSGFIFNHKGEEVVF